MCCPRSAGSEDAKAHVATLLEEKKQRYRPDVDGLRAIAVTSVVLFHAGLFPFKSGFVGVDIFFVISGYLIGGIILREVVEDRFRFIDFYARRARRILPALFLVVSVICIAGFFILSTAEYFGVGQTSMSALFASSNFWFRQHQDYFDQDSRLSPLLMTWSLGVEEQFYAVFPLLLLGMMRWAPRNTVLLLGLMTVVSFVFSAWCTATYPITAFYLLPSRAWELGAGATLAASELWRTGLYRPDDDKGSRVRQVLGVAGLCALAAGIFCLDPARPVPGFLALLPVVGTVALIWSEGSIVNRRLLSAKPMVFVGMISYSWYLWHWPLMSYSRIISVAEPQTWLLVLIGGLAFGCAILSWRYVEQPFRRFRSQPGRTIGYYAMALIVLLAVTETIKFGNGLPQRLSEQAKLVEATIMAGRGDCLATFTARSPDKSVACVIKRKGRPGIALVGDSHGAALGPGLRYVSSQNDWGVSIFTKSSCGPFLGVSIPHPGIFADACAAFVADSIQTIVDDPDITTVMFAGVWGNYTTISLEEFRDGLERSVAKMKAAGKRVIIVGDVPSWRFDPTKVEFAKAMPVRGFLARILWLDQEHPLPGSGVSTMTQPENIAVEAVLSEVVRIEGANWLDLRSRFCSTRGCAFEKNGELLYIDDGHLSTFGSRLALGNYAFSISER